MNVLSMSFNQQVLPRCLAVIICFYFVLQAGRIVTRTETLSETFMQFEKVMIVMGSTSDWPVMRAAKEVLDVLEIPNLATVVSAHRTPDRLYEFARDAELNGTQVIIAGAGGSAHLPGMVAAISHIPVVAVPVKSSFVDGLDSLLSIVQMPRGVAVGTQGVGEAGAYNAGVYAAQILACTDAALFERFKNWRAAKRAEVVLEIGQ